MLGVGEKFPEFSVKGVVSVDEGKEFIDVTEKDHAGKWKVFFFWPKDFTFVCPTELVGFGKAIKDFADRDTVIYAGSIDNEYSHLAWKKAHKDLTNLPYPMLAGGVQLPGKLGILDPVAGVAQRALFIVDPEGIVRFVYVTDLSVGRDPKEVLRVLDALQSGELCPCSWKKGEATL
jgi:peroxiredoxin (alkyl hydroperoxide reductase subunit C)